MMLVPCHVADLQRRLEETEKAHAWMVAERDKWRALATLNLTGAAQSVPVAPAPAAFMAEPITEAHRSLARALRAPATQTIGLFVA